MEKLPPKEMQRLGFLLGDWAGEMTFHHGGETHTVGARARIEPTLQGWWLCTQYVHDEAPGVGLLGGMTMLTFDADEGKYCSWEFQNKEGQAVRDTGGFKGENLVMTSDPMVIPEMGEVILRKTFRPEGESSLRILIEMGPVGGELSTMAEGVMSRV